MVCSKDPSIKDWQQFTHGFRVLNLFKLFILWAPLSDKAKKSVIQGRFTEQRSNSLHLSEKKKNFIFTVARNYH